MAVIGIVLGAAAAWLLGRAAQSLLFGIEAGDPLMLAAAAVVLAAVTLGAAYIPARRASRVDPMSVLRYSDTSCLPSEGQSRQPGDGSGSSAVSSLSSRVSCDTSGCPGATFGRVRSFIL